MSKKHGFDHQLRFLVASDLSPRADIAVDRAAQLASATGARLRVLHVLNDLPADLVDDLKERMRHVLASQIEAARSQVGPLEAEIEIAVGGGDDRILAAADRDQVDLIVCGDHREFESGDRWLGSTMDRVLRHGRHAVLVVKLPVRNAYARPLVAVDLSDTSARALAYAMRLLPGSTLGVLHAYQIPYAGIPKPRMVAGAVAAGVRSEEGERLALWLKQFETLAAETGCHLDPRLERGDAEAIVLKQAAETRADLVVLGTHGRTGVRQALLGSVAAGLIGHLDTDVLAVR